MEFAVMIALGALGYVYRARRRLAIYFIFLLCRYVEPSPSWRREGVLFQRKLVFAESFLSADYELRMTTDLDIRSRARFLVEEYKNYIR